VVIGEYSDEINFLLTKLNQTPTSKTIQPLLIMTACFRQSFVPYCFKHYQ